MPTSAPEGHRRRIVLGLVLSVVVSASAMVAGAPDARQAIVVRGCVERDAAASAIVYTLVTGATSGVKVYRLRPSGSIELAPHVGHTVEVTGTVSEPVGRGRQDPELVVQRLTMVAPNCP